MTIQPLNGHVLLRTEAEQESRSSGGIVLPATARSTHSEGIIEAMPPGGSDELALGDRVLYRPEAGEEVAVEGVRMRLVPLADVLVKLVQADPIAG